MENRTILFQGKEIDVDDKQPERKKPQTNEEWLCSLSTEEKAEFLKQIIKSCGWCLDGGNPPFCLLSGNKCFFNDGEFVEWLKENHHE